MHRLSSGSMMFCKNLFLIMLMMIMMSNSGVAQKSPHGPLKQECTDCHTTDSWKDLAVPMKFNHTTTGFSLQGVHTNIQCAQCHTAKRFAGTPTDCFACHQADFNKAMLPNHRVGRLSHECLTCHTMNGWRPSIFQHSKTNFQLQGAHLSVECSSCHTNNQFAGLPSNCFSCHQKNYIAVTNPNHVTAQFSHECLSCHTMNDWQHSTFDHNKTNFRLVGIHTTLQCASCHKDGQFKNVATDCYTCHQKDYAATVNPNHSAAQFNHDCSTCHSTAVWSPSTFDHAKAGFQLAGAHVSAECSKCHVSGIFKGTPKECYPCHQAQFDKTVIPNHAKGQLSHDCLTCHTNVVWKPSTFDHNKTNFQLAGAHVATECAKCHVNDQYKGLPGDCYTCHQANFAAATNPNHVTAQFSHDCSTCHSTIAWKPSTFNHGNTTFPLTGAHAAVDCLTCHKNGQYAGTTTVCYNCHQADFAGTTNPNHVTGNFDHNCAVCHSTTAWSPASFDHSKSNFPLTGKHTTAQCSSCHIGGKYAGTSTDCYTCHQKDYTSSTNPAHATGNFPTACATCHTTNGWTPSTFNHSPFFPIGSGDKHRPGSWSTCTDCHTNASNFKVFSCINCHEHSNKASVDQDHSGVTGYSYDSNACYKCHPAGRN